ncbi:MAG TPA: LodA/GoxA family CTQ-dependent oxidase [Blastocatellia bacterium]|nr:LodA/GoxA family CTQ-dependent oxidase [Blastocatellia bacterium]
MAKRYSIHPAIGVARVGTSAEFYVGPEIPGVLASPPDGHYRDAAKDLRRQAARFWVFESDDDQPALAPRPAFAGEGGIARIEWTVRLANKKAFWFKFDGLKGEGPAGYSPGHPLRNADIQDPAERRRRLIIDPGPRRLTDRNQRVEIEKGNSGGHPETWPGPLTGDQEIRSLGTLSTDAKGRLIVAGGFGVSGTTGPLPNNGHLNYDNNEKWFDDVSDGPVSARVVFDDGTAQEVTPAWLIVGPPDFAPPIENIVTMYDTLFDLAVRKFGAALQLFEKATGQFKTTYEPSFTTEVYPILRRAANQEWVIEEASGNHRWNYAALASKPFTAAPGVLPPEKIFNEKLRSPEDWRKPFREDHRMPRQFGDDDEKTSLTLTRTQYHIMRQWGHGIFKADWQGTPPPENTVTAAGLDRAALENCAGGAFFPGIEASWIMRDARIYKEPLRFKPSLDFDEEHNPNGLTPGSVTMRSALPWQADFLKCGVNWWPAQRPDQVRASAAATFSQNWIEGIQNHVDLVKRWSLLGIVIPAVDPSIGVKFHESEREL